MIDWTGLALFIVAAANAYQIVMGARRDKKLKEVHDLVNGQSKKLEELSYQKGVRKGGVDERKRPTPKR